MCVFIPVAANSYRTDDVAILRSFVICRAELTLQRLPTVTLISSFMVRKKRKQKNTYKQKIDTE